MQNTPGVADPRLSREEARPELAVQVDRPKAALFGLNTSQVAGTIRTNVAGTTAAQFRQGGYEYPIIVRLREEDREQVGDVSDVMVNTSSGVALPVKNVMTILRSEFQAAIALCGHTSLKTIDNSVLW